MNLKIKVSWFIVFISSFTQLNAQTNQKQINKLSDASDKTDHKLTHISYPKDYTSALNEWKSINEINNWIRDNFNYDLERAKQLGENSTSREKTSIYNPSELYLNKKGVCIDLSRFAVETTKHIDSTKHVQYLMIDFEPISIDGITIKKHWLAVYQDQGNYYLFADSKRPGHIAGPFKNIDDFISEYQTYRERKITSWKVLPTYQKKLMQKNVKQERG